MKTIEEIIKESPDNFVIQNALCRCFEIIEQHNKIVVLVSGGADSDVVLDIMIRCGCLGKTEFVFIDTGLEYQATREHIDFLEQKYGINIHRVKSPMSIPNAIHKFGVPFWGKFASEMLYRLQSHGFKFEDEPFDVLIKKYPKCKTALSWWCDVRPGKTTLFSIARSPYLKEFMVANPPIFLFQTNVVIKRRRMPQTSLCNLENTIYAALVFVGMKAELELHIKRVLQKRRMALIISDQYIGSVIQIESNIVNIMELHTVDVIQSMG